MKKRVIRPVSLLIAVLIAIFGMSACGGSIKTEESTTAAASATTQVEMTTAAPLSEAELVWYVVGDAHADQAMVDEALNKKLKQDLNCTVKLNFTGWGDMQSKYNLLLISGEPIDMIFVSTWADYAKYSKMGAFLDLTEMLPQYAPKTWSEVPKTDWESATTDGKIYAVPCTNPEFTPAGLFYREDLRKKFGLPEIKDVASIEAYMDGIKKNSPDMYPLLSNAIEDIESLYFWSNKYEPIAGAETDVVQVKSYDTPRELIKFPFTDEFVNFCKMTKEWKDKGYWPKDVLSTKMPTGDAVKAGKSATAWMTPSAAAGYFTNFEQEHKDWEAGYFPYSRLKGYACPNSPMNNGMAVPKSAKNAERSLMVLDLLRNDPDYNHLTTYGIQGYHWDTTDDGLIQVPAKGQDPIKNPGFWTTSWGWANYKLALTSTKQWKGWNTLNDEFKSMQRPSYLIDVKIDKEPVKTETAAIYDIQQNYYKILMYGLAPDVDKAIAEYRDKLVKAGIDRYYDEIQKQLFQYYDEKGIK